MGWCSGYGLQYPISRGKPVLIDTLSFETYLEGEPWVAYRQFCQHFLAPLSLMALRDVRLAQLLRIYIDGIPLDLPASLCPARHASSNSANAYHLPRLSKRFASSALPAKRQMSKTALLGWIDSLESAVKGPRWSPAGTDWGDYYTDTNYTPAGLEHKKELVGEFLRYIQPKCWDLGKHRPI
jgi:hypothetical protein